MKVKNLKIKGLKIVKSNIYRDKRGLFREISKQNILNEKWLFDCMSHSKKVYYEVCTFKQKNHKPNLLQLVMEKFLML